MKLITTGAAVLLGSTLSLAAADYTPQQPGTGSPINRGAITESMAEINAARTYLRRAQDPDGDPLVNAINALANAVTAISNATVTGFTNVFNALTTLGNAMTTGFTNLGNATTAGFTATIDALTTGFTATNNNLTAGFQATNQALTAGFTAVNNALTAGFTQVLNAIQAHDAAEQARFDALVQLITQIAQDNLRLQIERNLSQREDPIEQARTHRVVQFQLPAAVGGRLEFVRQIVDESIQDMLNSGLVISADAAAQLAAGDAQFLAGNYREAFDAYRRAYQAASYY